MQILNRKSQWDLQSWLLTFNHSKIRSRISPSVILLRFSCSKRNMMIDNLLHGMLILGQQTMLPISCTSFTTIERTELSCRRFSTIQKRISSEQACYQVLLINMGHNLLPKCNLLWTSRMAMKTKRAGRNSQKCLNRGKRWMITALIESNIA